MGNEKNTALHGDRVDKLTNNEKGGTSSASVTATSDKLFLLSYAEYVPTSYWATDYPWTAQEGSQYEFWAGKVTNNYGSNACLAKARANYQAVAATTRRTFNTARKSR